MASPSTPRYSSNESSAPPEGGLLPTAEQRLRTGSVRPSQQKVTSPSLVDYNKFEAVVSNALYAFESRFMREVLPPVVKDQRDMKQMMEKVVNDLAAMDDLLNDWIVDNSTSIVTSNPSQGLRRLSSDSCISQAYVQTTSSRRLSLRSAEPEPRGNSVFCEPMTPPTTPKTFQRADVEADETEFDRRLSKETAASEDETEFDRRSSTGTRASMGVTSTRRTSRSSHGTEPGSVSSLTSLKAVDGDHLRDDLAKVRFSARQPSMIDAAHHKASSSTMSSLSDLQGAMGALSSSSLGLRKSVGSAVTYVIKGRKRGKVAEAVFLFLDNPDSSRSAAFFSTIFNFLIMAAVALSVNQSQTEPVLATSTSLIIQVLVDSICLLEITTRFCVCPSVNAFLRGPLNICDLLAALIPLVLRIAAMNDIVDERQGAPVHYILYCGVPILRLLRVLRTFTLFYVFVQVFQSTFEALQVLLVLLSILVMGFASLIYLVENHDNIESLAKAIWFTIATMTTVGYGDVTPETYAGHLVGAFLMLVSVMYMAMPIGIIGNAFTQIWKDRDRILLMRLTRHHLSQLGYHSRDLPRLFRSFNKKGDGELCFGEFKEMMQEMQMPDSEKRLAQIFESIDKDGSGGIDAREFVRAVFPGGHFTEASFDVQTERRNSRGSRTSRGSNRSSRTSNPDDVSHVHSTDSQPRKLMKKSVSTLSRGMSMLEQMFLPRSNTTGS